MIKDVYLSQEVGDLACGPTSTAIALRLLGEMNATPELVMKYAHAQKDHITYLPQLGDALLQIGGNPRIISNNRWFNRQTRYAYLGQKNNEDVAWNFEREEIHAIRQYVSHNGEVISGEINPRTIRSMITSSPLITTVDPGRLRAAYDNTYQHGNYNSGHIVTATLRDRDTVSLYDPAPESPGYYVMSLRDFTQSIVERCSMVLQVRH